MTLFIDVDGTILPHQKDATEAFTRQHGSALPGVLKKFNDWSGKGYTIVLTTARKESMRADTEDQLRSVGLFWDILIMGISSGRRVLINDIKQDGYHTAVGLNVPRDEGFVNLDVIYRDTMKWLGVDGQDEI